MRNSPRAALIGAVLWAIAIFLSSGGLVTIRQLSDGVATVSGPLKVSSDSFAAWWIQVWWVFVKGWHFAEFAILTLLLHACFRSWRPAKAVLLAMVGALGYAFFDELRQTFVPGRGGRFSDVLIDALGIMVAGLWLERRDRTKGKWWIVVLILIPVIFVLSVFPFGQFHLGGSGTHRFAP